MSRFFLALLSLSFFMWSPAQAGEADVLHVDADRSGDGDWYFSVTVEHADEGWDHYADRWEVVSLDGDVLATRTLLHPHVDEQPFIRGLGGVVIPDGATQVIVRAHDSVHGYGGAEVLVDLPED